MNNVLTVLNVLLNTAVDWGLLDEVACKVKFLQVPVKEAAYHDFDEFDRLVDAAGRVDQRESVIVLLAGEAGLRGGEIMALRQSDIDWNNNALIVQRPDWKGRVTAPKSGRSRRVPMTHRLSRALKGHRHLRGRRVVCQADGSPLTQKVVRCMVKRASDRAGLANVGVHILRHTYCSHLAMRGAPVRAIQTLAGHADLTTTMRYMHLSPAALEAAVDLLNAPRTVSKNGDILETARREFVSP